MREHPKLGSLNAMEERQEAQASQDQGSGQDLLAATYRMTRMELSLVWPQEQTSRDNRCHTIGLCETFSPPDDPYESSSFGKEGEVHLDSYHGQGLTLIDVVSYAG